MQFIKIPAQPFGMQLPIEEIIRIESRSNYSKIYSTCCKPFVVSKVLQWFEGQLPAEMFARVHRSHLVNRQFILQVNSKNIRTDLIMINGELIPVSRRKKTTVSNF